jgi:hypothetical protein
VRLRVAATSVQAASPLCKPRNAHWLYNASRGLLCERPQLEFKHRLKQLVEVVPWLDFLGAFRTLMQQWEGDVTVLHRGATLLAENSTPPALYAAARQGERSMWTRLSALEIACGIEITMDECVARLKARQSGASASPSWCAQSSLYYPTYCSRHTLT